MTAYTVQKGDDGGDDSDSDGGSAVRLVRLVLVIRPLSGQLNDKTDSLITHLLLLSSAAGFSIRLLSNSLSAHTVLDAMFSTSLFILFVLFVLFTAFCRRCIATRRAFLASNASCAAAGDRLALM